MLSALNTNAAIVEFTEPYSITIDDTDPNASTLTINAVDVAIDAISVGGTVLPRNHL